MSYSRQRSGKPHSLTPNGLGATPQFESVQLNKQGMIAQQLLLLRHFAIAQPVLGLLSIPVVQLNIEPFATLFSIAFVIVSILCAVKVGVVVNLLRKPNQTRGWVYGVLCLWMPVFGGIICYKILSGRNESIETHNSAASEQAAKRIGKYVGRALRKMSRSIGVSSNNSESEDRAYAQAGAELDSNQRDSGIGLALILMQKGMKSARKRFTYGIAHNAS